MPQPLLQLNNLTRRFGGVVAVDNVTLSIAPGEVVGLIGPNGAGKSTLLHTIAGTRPADHGRIDRAGLTAADIALLPQDGQLTCFQVG